MKLKDLAGQAGVSAATVSIVRQGKPGVSAAPQEPAAAGDRHPRTPDVHIRIDTQLICRETLAEQQKEAEAP